MNSSLSLQGDPCISCLPGKFNLYTLLIVIGQYNFGGFSGKCADCPLGDICANNIGFEFQDTQYIVSKGNQQLCNFFVILDKETIRHLIFPLLLGC